MNIKTLVFGLLVVSVLLIGCTSSQNSGYAAYNQPQGSPQQGNPNIGGGCGVASETGYTSPAEATATIPL